MNNSKKWITAGAVMLGDIVISLEKALQQAEMYGHSTEREVAFLTVHSMHHLLGYDHENGGEEERIMRMKEEQVLENDPTVDTSKGAVDHGERLSSGEGNYNNDYNTKYETYIHMIQISSGDYDATVTLPAINYSACKEVYFGLRAITADGTGTVQRRLRRLVV